MSNPSEIVLKLKEMLEQNSFVTGLVLVGSQASKGKIIELFSKTSKEV